MNFDQSKMVSIQHGVISTKNIEFYNSWNQGLYYLNELCIKIRGQIFVRVVKEILLFQSVDSIISFKFDIPK